MKTHLLSAFLYLALVATVYGDTLHVPGEFPTIQAAIDAAVDGDEIIVAPGTYNEVINFIGKAITLRSSDGPDVTIIDGTDLNDSVVKCVSGEGADTMLEGFTITGGTGDPSVREGHTFGGGMRNNASNPTVLRCIFAGNTTSGSDGAGGGMYNRESAPTIVLCLFRNNSVSGGGGIWNYDSDPYISNTVFADNEALAGGAIVNARHSLPVIVNSVFQDNTALRAGAVMTNETSQATIVNTLFVGNDAGNQGGALLITDNAHVDVSNCVLWENSSSIAFTGNGAVTVTYSLIQGGWAGEGNIDADPLFVDPDNGDFRLEGNSPCIDAANNDAVPDGVETDRDGNPRFVDHPCVDDSGNGTPPVVDMGAYEFQFDGDTEHCPGGARPRAKYKGNLVKVKLAGYACGEDYTVQLLLPDGTPILARTVTTDLNGSAATRFPYLQCGLEFKILVADCDRQKHIRGTCGG